MFSPFKRLIPPSLMLLLGLAVTLAPMFLKKTPNETNANLWQKVANEENLHVKEERQKVHDLLNSAQNEVEAYEARLIQAKAQLDKEIKDIQERNKNLK